MVVLLVGVFAGFKLVSKEETNPPTVENVPLGQQLLYLESETAAQAASWLKELKLSPSDNGVVGTMLPYHLLSYLKMEQKTAIHQSGMDNFYDNQSLENAAIANLENGYALTTEILENSGLYFSRDHTDIGFWEIVEPTPGEYHYDIPDLIISSAQTDNIRNLITLLPFALWDQENAGYPPNSQNNQLYLGDYFPLSKNTGPGPAYNLTAYENFLSRLKDRYDGNGANDLAGLKFGLNYFEINNEPEGSGGGYKNKANDYITLLQKSREALGSNAIIMNGGALEWITQPEISTFWNTFFENGGNNYIDIFNMHYNDERNYPTTTFDNFETVLDYWDNLMTAHGGRKPIWITEFGTFAGTQGGRTQSEDDQAEWYLEHFCFGAARGVKKIFIDFSGDNVSGIGQSAMTYTAIGNPTPTARLIFYTQKLMNYKLAAFTDCEEIVKSEQYRFTVGGKSVCVLWGTHPLPMGLSGRTLKVTDVYGNETTTSSLTLTSHPVFVEVIGI